MTMLSINTNVQGALQAGLGVYSVNKSIETSMQTFNRKTLSKFISGRHDRSPDC